MSAVCRRVCGLREDDGDSPSSGAAADEDATWLVRCRDDLVRDGSLQVCE